MGHLAHMPLMVLVKVPSSRTGKAEAHHDDEARRQHAMKTAAGFAKGDLLLGRTSRLQGDGLGGGNGSRDRRRRAGSSRFTRRARRRRARPRSARLRRADIHRSQRRGRRGVLRRGELPAREQQAAFLRGGGDVLLPTKRQGEQGYMPEPGRARGGVLADIALQLVFGSVEHTERDFVRRAHRMPLDVGGPPQLVVSLTHASAPREPPPVRRATRRLRPLKAPPRSRRTCIP